MSCLISNPGIVLWSMRKIRVWMILAAILLICLIIILCHRTPEKRLMTVTAFCGCGECCGWERGNPRYWRLDFWNRYVSEGSRRGASYTGKTASGARLRQYDPGILSCKNLLYPWKLTFLLMRPWRLIPRKGTIAADTAFYPFGTRMYVPGYGWGIVEDRGGAIKGPDRIDVFFRSHRDTLRWGRRQVTVCIYRRRTKKI